MASKPNNKPLIQNKPATTPAKPAANAKAPVANKTAAKPVAPVAAKPTAKPVLKTAAAPKKASATPSIKVVNKVATAPEKDKADKDKPKTNKVKMERDSFTMPKEEYAQIATLKKRLEALDKPVKKSELLRAGLKLLSAMDDAALKATLASIPVIKTGRPKK